MLAVEKRCNLLVADGACNGKGSGIYLEPEMFCNGFNLQLIGTLWIGHKTCNWMRF